MHQRTVFDFQIFSRNEVANIMETILNVFGEIMRRVFLGEEDSSLIIDTAKS